MENDESIEKTTSTVEMATTKVERTASKNASATTGRTAWDALIDMGGMLGRYTPWIIIIAGLSYGAYHFIGLKNTTDDRVNKARAEAQKEVTEAQAAVKQTYVQIGEMHKQQLENLLSMLKVNEDTAKNTEQQRILLNNLQEQVRTKLAEAEKAQKDTDQARAEAISAQREREKAQKDADQARAEAIRAQREGEQSRIDLADERQELTRIRTQSLYDDTGFNLSRKEAALAQRAAQIKELRRKLIDMANSLADSTDSSVATLGRNILNDVFFEASKLLAAYANGENTAESLDDLVGSSEETFETALSEGLGFIVWQKYSKKDGTKTAYIGVVRQTDVMLKGVVFLTVEDKEVVDVQVFPEALSVVGWDPDNWNKPIAYNLYLRPTGEPGIDIFTPKTEWTIRDVMTEFAEEGPPIEIYGREKPLYFISFDDLQKEAKILYDKAKADNRWGFSNVVAMLDNEKGFDANKIAEPFATEMPKGIRDTFVQLLTESVKR